MPRRSTCALHVLLPLLVAFPAWAQKKPPKPKNDDLVGQACSPSSTNFRVASNPFETFQKAMEIYQSGPLRMALQPSLANQAVILFCESGRGGSAIAAFYAADLLDNGHFAYRGMKSGNPLYVADPWLAAYWYQVSAEGGYDRAMTRLAAIYRGGLKDKKDQIIAPDPVKAAYWSNKAGGGEDTRRMALEYQDIMRAKPPDHAKAEELDKRIKAILNNYQKNCEMSINTIRRQLPLGLGIRPTEKLAAVMVTGSNSSRQIVCQVHFAEEREKPEPKSGEERARELEESLKRIDDAQGADILIWQFTVTESGGNVDARLESALAARIGYHDRQEFERLGVQHLVPF